MRTISAQTIEHDKTIANISKVLLTPLNLDIINTIKASNNLVTDKDLQPLTQDSLILDTQIAELVSSGLITKSDPDGIIKYSLDKSALMNATMSLTAFFKELEALRIKVQPITI